jgi:hypothetical protein
MEKGQKSPVAAAIIQDAPPVEARREAKTRLESPPMTPRDDGAAAEDLLRGVVAVAQRRVSA